jgi:RsiW-degrading membrane proteinase PrsW (M82 family)
VSFDWATAGVLGAIAACALMWVQYYDLKDAFRPEPRHMLALAFGLGALSALIALGGYELVRRCGLSDGPGVRTIDIAIYCFFVVGPVEEGAKFLVARAVLFRSRWFDEAIDGLVYAAAVGIGFSFVESLLYLPLTSRWEQIARAIAGPFTHSLLAAVWGLAAGWALVRMRPGPARTLLQAGALVLSMALHGMYDTWLLAWGATLPAGLTIFCIWAVVIWRARKTVRGRIPEVLGDEPQCP